MSTTEIPRDSEPKVRVRWGLILFVTIVGLIVTGAPFISIWLFGADFGNWQSLLASTLTNVGTAILLVAAFWLLEQLFTARIKNDVRETARATAAEETRELAETQQDLAQRLDEIQQRLDDRVSMARQEEDSVLRRLDRGTSFDTVYAAFALGEKLGAIWQDELTVPTGSGEPRFPRFRFRLTSSSTTPPHRLRSNEDLTPLVEVEYVSPGTATQPILVHWDRAKGPDVVLAELRQMLLAAGFAEQATHVDVSLFTNLQVALNAAVSARRRDASSWFKGALTEWVNADWAVTSYGLEHRGPHGMRSEEFPVQWNGRSNVEVVRWKVPAAPEGVDEVLWDFLITSASQRHRPGVPFPA